MLNPEQLTILITGATDGLGQRVATDLARMGATLLLHGRDPEKGRRVLSMIREVTGNNRLHYFNADRQSTPVNDVDDDRAFHRDGAGQLNRATSRFDPRLQELFC